MGGATVGSGPYGPGYNSFGPVGLPASKLFPTPDIVG